MSSSTLAMRVRREPGGTAIITVTGEIDIATVAGLRDRLFTLADTSRSVIIDLDQVSFIDAAGLGALVGAARRADFTAPACRWSAASRRPGSCSA